jgi:hypothetical protein
LLNKQINLVLDSSRQEEVGWNKQWKYETWTMGQDSKNEICSLLEYTLYCI